VIENENAGGAVRNLTVERLRELLHYDRETGVFTWRVDRQRARKGDVAGTICPMYGYRLIGIDYKHYRANRLAWLYVTGIWPEHLVDHKDRNRANDAWLNLRQASVKQNNENRAVGGSSLSGRPGVSWQPARNRWCAHITNNGVTKNLGRFKTLEEAIEARAAAESLLFTHAA